ncbi:MAG TPA: hypothetical protein VLA72_07075 [Anaerolineales bacterium]|jgi:hypothetical protein|nr:hypothetical protein [Anaerolineales bacterium]
MDPVKILKRAWHILWSYRALWVFGLILALAAGGSSGGSGNSGSSWSSDPQDAYQPESLPDAFRYMNEEMDKLFDQGSQQWDLVNGDLRTVLWMAGIFVLVMVIFGIVMAIARYVSETAVIRMVDEYEGTETKMTVREGFRSGWSRTSWRLFLINLIVSLPAILLVLALVLTGVGFYFAVEKGNLTFASLSVIAMIGVVFLLIFAVIILSIALKLLRQFVWRVSALEDLGVSESFSRGWAMVRENWKDVGLMWLVMLGLGIAWAVASIILFIVTIPVLLITVIAAVVIVAIPALLLVGLFSLFLSPLLAWVFGILFVLPLFFILAFSPWVLIGSWQAVFTSTVWTLTYREIKAIPTEPMAELPAES